MNPDKYSYINYYQQKNQKNYNMQINHCQEHAKNMYANYVRDMNVV